MKYGGVTCSAGHVHKNERSADDCEQRSAEREVERAAQQSDRINLIAPEFAEHGGSYFISRQKKTAARKGR